MFRYLILILSMFISIESYGCSCTPFELKEAVYRSDLIYFAQIISAKIIPAEINEYEHVEGTLKIIKVLKGKFDSATINVRTGLGGGDCGIPLIVSVTYVIFARKGSNDIGNCSGSKPLNYFATFEGAEDLSDEIKAIVSGLPKN